MQNLPALSRSIPSTRCHPVQSFFSATVVLSAGSHEDTAIKLDKLEIDRVSTGGMVNGVAGADTPVRAAKIAKRDLFNRYIKNGVVV